MKKIPMVCFLSDQPSNPGHVLLGEENSQPKFSESARDSTEHVDPNDPTGSRPACACGAHCGQARSGCSSSLALHQPCSCAHQRQAEPLLCTCHHLPAARCSDRAGRALLLRAAGHRVSSFAQSLAPCVKRLPPQMQWCPRHRTQPCLHTESASCSHSTPWASTRRQR